ncbi:hypothetical protein M011DRAFT_527749 [Sporormia fimetaria CBS 119925]|uniref:Uncharacterized protein n=1 Tax=Sporormia fimetaria CBS 119925 TaxID=1340428 RepID=A0A6A6V422_9PLEO|nr:hypothetical protein M011DRAFT_527749 [Sporormia fimetaria CBS 119925]
MLLSRISIFIPIITGLTAAAAVDRTAVSTFPIPGYELVDLEWDIEVSPGQHEILTGTVEEVIAKATSLSPNFMATMATIDEDAALSPADADTTASRDTLVCLKWELANMHTIQEGIQYLRSLRNKPRLPAGPKKCSRVSGSYNSAIFFCNDNNHLIDLTKWDGIC